MSLSFIPWDVHKLTLFSGHKLYIQPESKALYVLDEKGSDPATPQPVTLDLLLKMGVDPLEAINDVMPLINSGEIKKPSYFDLDSWVAAGFDRRP